MLLSPSFANIARTTGRTSAFIIRHRLKLDIDFLSNCKQLGVYRKFFILKLRNVCNKDALSIRKRLHRSVITKRNKELQYLSKELYPKTFYLHSFLLLTSTFLQNLQHRITRNRCRICYTLNKNVIFTDQGLQFTYIHS